MGNLINKDPGETAVVIDINPEVIAVQGGLSLEIAKKLQEKFGYAKLATTTENFEPGDNEGPDNVMDAWENPNKPISQVVYCMRGTDASLKELSSFITLDTAIDPDWNGGKHFLLGDNPSMTEELTPAAKKMANEALARGYCIHPTKESLLASLEACINDRMKEE